MRKTILTRFFEFLADLVFPSRCPACHRVVGWNEYFCSSCEKRLEYLDEYPCIRHFQDRIGDKERAFDDLEALFEYDGTARQAVLSFKYHGSRRLAEYSAERLFEKLANREELSIDVITYVPMHPINRMLRGYNQAELLARALAKEFGIGTEGGLIGHRFRLRAQHNNEGTKRYSSAERTYYLRKRRSGADKPLAGKSVLICDDIITSGATINKCSELLKELGAEKVCAVSICIRL